MASAGLGATFWQLRGLFGGGSVVALEDGQLLARYELDRDEAAFEALVGRHGPMVLTTCRAVLRNEHDVEDAFQATFLVLARKAGSIRGEDALGGWLHRVAYRASVQAGVEQARRRRKEAEAAEARRDAARPGAGPDPESELVASLHEEIDRLPESHRLPVVLCDLEGLTYEQAARQLRWTVPALRNRLARARQRLKARLASRGAPPAAIGAAVPASLARSTLAAALGGPASAGASLLTRIILRGMLMTRIKVVGLAALAGLALASAGVVALAGGRPGEDPGPAPRPDAGGLAREAPPFEEPGERVEVRGVVVAPDGRPVAGAKVQACGRGPGPGTTSGPDGRFRLRVSRWDPSRAGLDSDYPWVVASAPGHGLGWIKHAFEPGPSGESTVRLVEEGPPIEGKVIDLEGRPASGVRVQVKTAWVADLATFGAWIARVKAQEVQSPTFGLVGLATPIEVTTGLDGRFRLAELGRDRVATLLLSGPSIASSEVQVLAYDGPEIRSTPPAAANALMLGPPRTTVFHASGFQVVAGPTRPIEGVVRDKDTGRPIEGLTLRAAVFDPRNLMLDEDVVARTDAQGRYRLTGMPAAPAYRLVVTQAPGEALPYANASFRTPADAPAAGPIAFDIALKRGVVVRGRATDRATGRPVTGHVDAFVFADNPFAAEFPGFPANPTNQTGYSRTDQDGRFVVVIPPGRGLLAFRESRAQYLMGLGAEAIAGYDPKRGMIRVVGRSCLLASYHVFAEVNFDPKADSATFDLQVDPGRSLDLAVVDPEGRPLDGLKAVGTSQNFTTVYPSSSPIPVKALDPTRPRRLNVYHDGRKLVGSVWLKGDEVGPLTLRLAPWGAVSGRFLDANGNPLASHLVQFVTSQSPIEEEGLPRPTSLRAALMTDQDGRFFAEGLTPGLKYAARPFDRAKLIPNPPSFHDVVVAPGEVKDLGDLKPGPPPQP